MAAKDNEDMKNWIASWARAGKALKEIKRRELRAYDYQENKAVVDGMLQWACDHATPRLDSGLVEQQRFFKKLRNENKET